VETDLDESDLGEAHASAFDRDALGDAKRRG
jgi:hypothetical protein